jgi:hypothetical protein
LENIYFEVLFILFHTYIYALKIHSILKQSRAFIL